ncbi:MAG: restriction endonuclease subunit S, partial [Candidatus Paceibacteria bacterium]
MQIPIIRADRSEIHPEYLYYILKSPIYQNKIQNIAVGSTGQIELNKGDLTNLKVSFPRKLVQEKIVGIVRPIDEKISTNRATNRILEKIIQSYFKHEFVDYDNYENYKESDIGEIPEGFEVVEVKELCN